MIVIVENLNDRDRDRRTFNDRDRRNFSDDRDRRNFSDDRDRRNVSDRDRGCRNLDGYEYENFSHRKFVIKFSNNQKLFF